MANNKLFITTILTQHTFNNVWYVDFSAIQHMTPNKNWFISYSESWPKEKIFLGDENSYEIAQKGVVVVELEYG